LPIRQSAPSQSETRNGRHADHDLLLSHWQGITAGDHVAFDIDDLQIAQKLPLCQGPLGKEKATNQIRVGVGPSGEEQAGLDDAVS
jgi:hypothetical protein